MIGILVSLIIIVLLLVTIIHYLQKNGLPFMKSKNDSRKLAITQKDNKESAKEIVIQVNRPHTSLNKKQLKKPKQLNLYNEMTMSTMTTTTSNNSSQNEFGIESHKRNINEIINPQKSFDNEYLPNINNKTIGKNNETKGNSQQNKPKVKLDFENEYQSERN